MLITGRSPRLACAKLVFLIQISLHSLRARFAYDDTHVYVLAQVRASYYFNLTAGNSHSHAFSVMWKVGADAIMQTWTAASSPLLQPTPPVLTIAQRSSLTVEVAQRCATVIPTWWTCGTWKQAAQVVCPVPLTPCAFQTCSLLQDRMNHWGMSQKD